MLNNRCISNLFGYCELLTEPHKERIIYSPGPRALVVSIVAAAPCHYRWDTCAFFISAIEEIRQDRVQSKTKAMKSSS